jgi:hypothetical protein
MSAQRNFDTPPKNWGIFIVVPPRHRRTQRRIYDLLQLIELGTSEVLHNESPRCILFARNVGHPTGIRLVGQGAARV